MLRSLLVKFTNFHGTGTPPKNNILKIFELFLGVIIHANGLDI
jgi:hypothetical protein